MKSICGANCKECELFNKKCQGCKNTNGCPYGKKCWIAKYLELGKQDEFNKLKEQIINEINLLKIIGMPKLVELYPLNGEYVNLEYTLPNGIKTRFLSDKEVYLGNQLECEFNDKEIKKCFGIVANLSFIIICEYGEDGSNPELIMYIRR